MQPTIETFATADALASAAAERVAGVIGDAVSGRGRCTIALSGGSTPERLYRALADPGGPGAATAWRAVHVCWGDERHVPPTHRDCNARMAREALLDHVPIPYAQIHPIDGGNPDAEAAAREYEETLRGVVAGGRGAVPEFDLVLLGMGPDGHVASLFPGSPALAERTRLVVAPWVAALGGWRITLTPPVLLEAREIVVLVTGREKAPTLRAVLEGPMDPARLPAQLLRNARGRVRWLTDRDAAAALSRE